MFGHYLARRAALCTALAATLVLAAPAAAQQPRTPAAGVPARAPIDYGTAKLERQLEVVRATGRITLDGALDEPSWSAAPSRPFTPSTQSFGTIEAPSTTRRQDHDHPS